MAFFSSGSEFSNLGASKLANIALLDLRKLFIRLWKMAIADATNPYSHEVPTERCAQLGAKLAEFCRELAEFNSVSSLLPTTKRLKGSQ